MEPAVANELGLRSFTPKELIQQLGNSSIAEGTSHLVKTGIHIGGVVMFGDPRVRALSILPQLFLVSAVHYTTEKTGDYAKAETQKAIVEHEGEGHNTEA